MGQQTLAQRCMVHLAYQEKYGEKLYDVIKSECGRKPFGKTLQYLSVPPDWAECYMLHDACQG